ncbi:LexA-binding, inner membrane-associated putative hydrolase [Sediminihabitans luteus]|uniref:LexA-binding, inner membrane-associated putative hydrolase n=1 Tax=Sediminihabitans luteus TaxID=1138585 RepID=A0A2M9CR52_9CELL|nr:metal-dependent hydrolase [Sediminihabitans luteus]PJJ74384.1 LexA-binding, inner membrane-associated putative hydrolase [Sediminihabitans luteus]GIJ00250.1 metal-dependent hydrolase [Sediminihabitans luteus]
MMGGHHAASGAAAWVALASTAPLTLGVHPVSNVGVITGAIVCAGAALLPDADHHSGTIAHSLPPVSEHMTRAIGAISGGHRNGTHSILGVVVFTAIAWLAGTWTVQTEAFGEIGVGAGIMTILLAAFALKALKLTRNGKFGPWVSSVTLAVLIALLAPEEWNWMPFAVALGCIVHILGDVLTTGGCPLLWPIEIKSPRWVRRNRFLGSIWKSGGGFALPILGDAGSVREWIVMTPVSIYAVFGVGWALLTQMGFDTQGTLDALTGALR